MVCCADSLAVAEGVVDICMIITVECEYKETKGCKKRNNDHQQHVRSAEMEG